MVNKKVVDDYYANISSESETPEDKSVVKKLKLKVKKKAVSKDHVDSKTEIKDTSNVSEDKQKITLKKDIKPKKIIQTIKVVKKADRVNKEEPKKRVPIKIVKKADQVVKSTEKKEREPKVYKTKGPVVTKRKEEEEKKPKGLRFNDRKTRGRIKYYGEKDTSFTRSNKLNKRKKEEKNVEDIKQNLVDRKGETIMIPDFLTLKEFSEKIGVALPKLIAEFMKNGMMLNINSKVDFDSASIIAESFEIKLERNVSAGAKIEDVISGDLSTLTSEDDSSKLVKRSPVVSIMGHVDHGKTSLLDYIRKSKVTTGEAGGITQSIGAYQVELDNGKITFLDTPGHEAFTIMRARGAKLTDIAILVVAADEGVKPQTIESISHAKEAGIPVVVAINKMDKEGANPDHVKGQLSENGLVPEDWGGDVPMIPVSAISGFGIEDLLEVILLVAEMGELKANPNRNAICTAIESHLDNKFGPVATVLVNTGTLKIGDNIVCQDGYGKIKVLKNHNSQNIKKATIGEPVLIVGLNKVVKGGDILQVVSTQDVAKEKALEYKTILENQKLTNATGLDLLMSKIKAGNLKQLKIILKADTNGSLEAIKSSLIKLSTPETTVSIIHSGVGNINEGDILMGQGSEAILVGFNVGVLPTAKTTLDGSGVEYISSDIIYHITERIEKIVTGMLDPKEVETILCRAKVGGIFYTSKEFMVLGLTIKEEEKIQNKTQIRVIRNKKMIGTGKIDSLKSGTLEVKELEGPTECGIKFIGNIGIEMGDELEVYKVEIQK